MKKVLLASTVLAMTATVAAADVTVSGSARMGVIFDDSFVDELAFTSRARVNFAMSGETDTGLSFGASFNAHDSGGANSGTAGSVFISGAFGKLSMGDVSGAAEFVVGDLHGVGLTGLGDFNEQLYLSNSDADFRSAARYEYSTGGLTFALSSDNPRMSDTYALGVKYSVDAFAVSLGYENAGSGVNHVIVGAETTLSGLSLKAVYGQADLNGFDEDFDQYGVSVKYSMDALSVTAFYNVVDFDVSGKADAYGIGAEYALGGGASLAGGIVNAEDTDGFSNTRADFGVKFSF
ncbi:porin [Tabrizicola sp. WMC-M-20]|nr:porin [Tabrizicola sp. WMC-M-20]